MHAENLIRRTNDCINYFGSYLANMLLVGS